MISKEEMLGLVTDLEQAINSSFIFRIWLAFPGSQGHGDTAGEQGGISLTLLSFCSWPSGRLLKKWLP